MVLLPAAKDTFYRCVTYTSLLVCVAHGVIVQDYRIESRDVEELGPHALRKRTLKSGRKKKERISKADPNRELTLISTPSTVWLSFDYSIPWRPCALSLFSMPATYPSDANPEFDQVVAASSGV